MAISQSPRADAAQLHLLFAKGKRPDAAAIMAFAVRQQAVGLSHELTPEAGHSEEENLPQQPVWIELLRDGLTFDLGGLAPSPAGEFPTIRHRLDLTDIPTSADHEALSLVPGPHLVAGARSQPVIRAMLALACDLILHFDDLVAICWAPSNSAIGRRFFESIISAWLDGGPFPALGLTTFAEQIDGALQSEGLAFWIGQELRIEPPLSTDKVAATRLGIRLVNQLIISGGLDADDRIIAPDGTPLVLRPSHNRAIISVWRE